MESQIRLGIIGLVIHAKMKIYILIYTNNKGNRIYKIQIRKDSILNIYIFVYKKDKMENLNNHLEEIQIKIGYHFLNIDLLIQAFTRKTYSEENGGADNEVLEFVGDRVLDFYVTKILIDRYGYIKQNFSENFLKKNKNEFFVNKFDTPHKLTDIKKDLVEGPMLSKRIDILKFNELQIMGNGDILLNIEKKPSVKEDLFEAILGAIALDSKWDTVAMEKSVKIMLDMDGFLSSK